MKLFLAITGAYALRMLAEAKSDGPPEGFEHWLASLAYLVGLIYLAVKLVKEFRSDKIIEREFVPRTEIDLRFKECHTKIDDNVSDLGGLREDMEGRHEENKKSLVAIDQKLDRNFNSYADTHRVELRGVHERVNEVSKGVASIQGEMKHIMAGVQDAAKSAITAAEAARGAIQAAAEVGRNRRA